MKAGRLRYSVEIRQQDTTKNSRGELADTWEVLATRRASIEPLNGKEYWAQSGEHSNVDTRIRMRWNDEIRSIKPQDVIVDTAPSPEVVYDIQSVIRPRETALELVLMCVRRNP